MNGKRILIILGVVFIIIQIVAFVGMSKSYVGLYPDSDDCLYGFYYTKDSGLNFLKVLFAAEAGLDRFKESFEDLSGEEDYILEATQRASAMCRESLGCSDGGSFGLVIYDAVLTISYCLSGIFGVFFLLVSDKLNGKTNE